MLHRQNPLCFTTRKKRVIHQREVLLTDFFNGEASEAESLMYTRSGSRHMELISILVFSFEVIFHQHM